MKILQILPELNVGGVETGTVDFAKYLVDHGHESVVVSNGGQLVKTLEEAGSKHYALPVHKKSLWTMLKCIGKLRKIIINENIDIVHARSRVPGWIAYFACRKTNASFITTCHGYYNNRLFSQVMGWAKFVIVLSRVIGRHMVEDFKVPSENIRIIPRSVDLSRFSLPRQEKRSDNQPTIAIVGRITPLKGHRFFIQAMAQVIRSFPYARIWIIGDASKKKESYKQELKLLVSRLGLSDNVEFLGSRKDIPELLSKIDVLVLSTVTQEAFGRVIVEAQAMGVPVVATRVGGVVDIIDDEKTGLLVMPKDTDAMARAVMRLIKDKALASEIVKNAKEKLLQNYTLEHQAAKTLKVYEELLDSLNILIIKLSSIGDVILSTAAIKAIRKKFPRAKIHCLVGSGSRKVLQNCPCIDDLIVCDTDEFNWLRVFKLASRLRKHKIDKVIDFQNNRKSHVLSFMTFPRESYGFNNKKFGFLLTNPVKKSNNRLPAVQHQFQILEMLGIDYKSNSALELWLTSHDRNAAKSLLDSEWLGNSQKIVGISISASEKWQTKNWPAEYIAKLCDLLSLKNIRVILTGVEDDRDLAREIIAQTNAKPANFVGKTDILQLAALIKRCNVFITPDSAPMHLAAAVSTPFIALFGPTDPERHIPPARKFSVVTQSLACSPCYSARCRIFTHACMRTIMPEDILKKVQSLLEVE